jgi:hypothetical protein
MICNIRTYVQPFVCKPRRNNNTGLKTTIIIVKSEIIDVGLLSCNAVWTEALFLRNVGICLQVYTAS